MKIFELLAEETKVPSTGYHGTVKANRGEFFFDTRKIHPTDQFLGEGFYFTIDRNIAVEYANIRAIRGLQILDRNHPKAGGSQTYYMNADGAVLTTSSLMKGEDVDGNPIFNGQEILEVDLSGLKKTYFIKDNAARLAAKGAVEKLKAEGYDSIAFEGFSDRSKQIMVFPEHIDKIRVKSKT